MMRLGFVVQASLSACVSSVAAQAFNIDFGTPLSTPPSDTYGAGSGQIGFWNRCYSAAALRDISGNLTGATFGGHAGAGIVEIPGATGDDELLMESSFLFPKNGNGVTILNLAPGPYDLYAYGWNDTFFHAHRIGVSVFNSATNVGGIIQTADNWPGAQVFGQTYTRFRVEVLPGFGYLNIMAVNLTFDYEILSGIQLVPVPEPGAILPLLWMLYFPRRRR